MTPPRQDKQGAEIAAAQREEGERAVEREKSASEHTAEQSTKTAAQTGARKLVGVKDGKPVYEEISPASRETAEQGAKEEGQTAKEIAHNAGNTVSQESQYADSRTRASQGTAQVAQQGESQQQTEESLRASMIERMTGEVEDGFSAADVKELPGPDGRPIRVSPNRAVAAAEDAPNIVEEGGRLISPFQPNKHSEVEITGGMGGLPIRGSSPRTRLVRSGPQKISDEMIDSMTSAQLRAIAHDRGYASVNGTGTSVTRAQFKQAQKNDQSLAQQSENPQELAEKKFQETQERQKQEVAELEKREDERAKQMKKAEREHEKKFS